MQLFAVCERYDSTTPYYTVRRLLRGLLDLPAEGIDEELRAMFVAELERRAPELLPWAPLIGMAIAVTVPETRETLELEEEFRRTKLAEAVIALLAVLLPEAGLITIEDVHFMDEASADLFGHIARVVHLTSWLWCLTRRDVASGFMAPEDTPVTRVELDPLSHDEAAALAFDATHENPLPRREMELLVDRSGGNPLFVRELVAAVLQRRLHQCAARLGRGRRRRPHRPPPRARPSAPAPHVGVGPVLLGPAARRCRRGRAGPR